MGHYDAFDPTPYRTHMRTLEWIRPGERILEVGCSTGALTERIRAAGCIVIGVEARPDAAERARAFCEDVLVGDVERVAFPWPRASFDVILLLDVLEHLVDPARTIDRVIPYLRPGGRVIVALPNVAHWSVRLRLLAGRFQYEDSGILDRTHLHLYTLASARELLAGRALEIVEEEIVPDVPVLRYKPRFARLNHRVARLLPGFFATESLFVARPRRTPASP